MQEKYGEITNFAQQFSEDYAYDFQRKVIPHVANQKKQIQILCLDYVKQPDKSEVMSKA